VGVSDSVGSGVAVGSVVPPVVDSGAVVSVAGVDSSSSSALSSSASFERTPLHPATAPAATALHVARSRRRCNCPTSSRHIPTASYL
jgi:hypothetical protein